MRILLPPSEGKTAARTGPPVALRRLTLPELEPVRQRVLDALTALSRGDADLAARVLKLGERSRADLDGNARLAEAPTAAARAVYTGVLYDALDLANLTGAVRRRAAERLLVFSGLWGVLRAEDAIPAYRCPIGANLPGLGGLGPLWRRALTPVLAREFGEEFLVDLRSGSYAAMWRPAPDRHAAVRVLQERVVDGEVRRTVVSHFNKATKGRLAAKLLREGVAVGDFASLVEALRDLKYRVEADAPRLDVIVTEL